MLFRSRTTSPVPGFTAGRWYNPKGLLLVAHGGTLALTANSIYGCPLWLPPGGSAIDRVGIAVNTGAGTNTRIMSHEMLPNGLPGDLIEDYGLVNTSTSGDKEITVATRLPGGIVWLTCIPDAAITVFTYQAGNWQGLGWTSQAGEIGGPIRANGSQTAPNPFGTTSITYMTNGFVRLAVRAA